MEDEETQYDSYEGESESISDVILYPLIASVFSAFILISIGAFILSNKKCCLKRNRLDSESALMKERLLHERKKLLSYKFNLPFRLKPVMSPVLQQEENEIAKEVKETYKYIQADTVRSNLCCINDRIQKCHHLTPGSKKLKFAPKEIDDLLRSGFDKNVIDNGLVKSVPNTVNSPAQHTTHIVLDSIEKIAVKEFDLDSLNDLPLTANKNGEPWEHNIDHLNKNDLVNRENAVTGSEIVDSKPTKSLLLNNWINGDMDCHEKMSSSIYEADIPYDDNDSLLTSISRMDASRMRRLRDSKFYQNLILAVNDECYEDEESLNEITSIKLNADSEANLTHEELMQAVLRTEQYSRFSLGTGEELKSDVQGCSTGSLPTLNYLTGSSKLHLTDESESSYCLNVISTEFSLDTSTNSTSETTTTRTSSGFTRPSSLDLKRRNTDLKIDVNDFTRNSSFTSMPYTNRTSYSSSSSHSTLTTWQEIESTCKSRVEDVRRLRKHVDLSSEQYSSRSSLLTSTAEPTCSDLSKKFRTPKKYKSPRRLARESCLQKHLKQDELANSYSKRTNQGQKASKKQLPKFVTGRMQTKRKQTSKMLKHRCAQ